MAEEDIWEGDLLGRKEEGKYLQRYIENLYKLDKKDQTSFVLNINSEWGYGKTWFLKRLKAELAKNHPVVYFDAWKNDFSKDALLSFVSIICEELSKIYRKKSTVVQKISQVKSTFSLISKNALPVLVSILVKQLTGKAFDDIELSDDTKEAFADASEQLSKVVSTSMIDGFINQKNAIDDFSNAIQSLVSEIKNHKDLHLPICIMVDELDRCRPTYAIELLESIKHLFAAKGLFFILATDTAQLGHSIKAIYGQGFSSDAYLKRFFYSEYNLSLPDYDRVAGSLFDSFNLSQRFLFPSALSRYGVHGIFSKTSEFFKLNIRDQKQVFFNLETIVATSDVTHFHFIFLIFLICLKHKFMDDYRKIADLKNPADIRTFISNKLVSSDLKELYLEGVYWDENFGPTRPFKLKDLFETYYDSIVTNPNDLTYDFSRTGFEWVKEVKRQVVDQMKELGAIDYFDLLDRSGKIKSLG